MKKGSTARAWSLAVALGTVNASCTGYRPPPDFVPGEVRAPTPVPDTPLTLIWRSKPNRGPTQPLTSDGVNAYLGGSDRRLVAVDLASGRTKWAVRFGGPLVGGVLGDGERVYGASDQPEGQVRALKPESGSEAWRVSTGYVQAPLARAGDRIIATTRSGRVFAIERATGDVAWRRNVPSSRVPPFPLDDQRVLITSYDSLYVLALSDGRVERRVAAPGPVTGAWRRLGSRLIGGTGDSTIVALGADSLNLLATVHLDGPVLTTPAAIGDTLYGITQSGAVWLVDATAGLTARRLNDLRLPTVGTPQVLGQWLLVGGADGVLHGLDRATAAESWRLQLGRPAEIAPFILPDSNFLALGGRGDLHRLQP
jgi:outer membrane protein assembly factor BamB